MVLPTSNLQPKIILYVANANDDFSEEQIKIIQKSFRRAKDICVKLLEITWGIDIIAYNTAFGIIPEDGVGGFAEMDTFLRIFIDAKRELNEDILFTNFCHEINHAVRYRKLPSYDARLSASIISEGLAVAFEGEISSKNGFFFTTIKNRNNSKKQYEKIKSKINDTDWMDERDKLFFSGDKKLDWPRWMGYEVGYYLVQERMRAAGKKASELIGEPVDSFMA